MEINEEKMNKITVDYTKTVYQAIAEGNYDWKNSKINDKNFPTPEGAIGKKIEKVTQLFDFNIKFSVDEFELDEYSIILSMHNKGFRPATLMENLFFGIEYPNLQKLFPIVGLGSTWRDMGIGNSRFSPYLYADKNGRKLGLVRYSNCRGGHNRYLGVLEY